MRFKKTVVSLSIAASGAVGTVGYDQLRDRPQVMWEETKDGPVIIKTFEASKFKVNALALSENVHIEENKMAHTMEYDPNLAVKAFEAVKAFIMKLAAADFNCSPKPEPTPTPPPVEPPPPTGSEKLSWGYTKVKSDEANAKITSTTKIKVCVVDTGVDLTHPDLPKPIASIDFSATGVQDGFGHGTHVSGIIGALKNDLGMRGVAYKNVELLIARVLNASGQGSWDAIVNGGKWCASMGAKVINFSLGGDGESPLLQSMVKYLDSLNIQTFMAAGNSYNSPIGSPARYANKITSFAISATEPSDVIAAYSSHGPGTFAAAPGSRMLSTVPLRAVMCNGATGYCEASGTSMATPVASAICVLHLLAGNTNCSNMKPGFVGDPLLFGKGRLDAYLSVLP